MVENENTNNSENINNQSNDHKVYYNDEYMQGIDPYLESLTFFTKVSEISNEFSSKYKENNQNPNLPDEFESIGKFIQYFIDYSILRNNNTDENFEFDEKEKISFEKNPEKIFSFFLDELHKIFKKNSNEEDNIRAPEYEKNKAYQVFNEFLQNDKSIISDLFFGEKLIQKYCNNCQLERYLYKYLEFISLDLKSQNKDINIDLEKIIIKIEDKFEKNDFCPICSSNQKTRIKIKITKKPNFLIIIIKNPQKDFRINFPQYIYNKEYELIAVEANINNDITNVFLDIKKCFSNIFNKIKINKIQKKYNLFFKKENENIENNENYIKQTVYDCRKPYVLFYKRKKKRIDRSPLSEVVDLSEQIMISNEKNKDIDIGNNLNNSILNKINQFENDNKKKIINKNNINNITNNNISNENISNNSINNNNNYHDDSKMYNQITLYFHFIHNKKELFIDVNDNEKFENIIRKLINYYHLDSGYNFINENFFYFKDINIDIQKSPKQLGIKSESKIYVKSKH